MSTFFFDLGLGIFLTVMSHVFCMFLVRMSDILLVSHWTLFLILDISSVFGGMTALFVMNVLGVHVVEVDIVVNVEATVVVCVVVVLVHVLAIIGAIALVMGVMSVQLLVHMKILCNGS